MWNSFGLTLKTDCVETHKFNSEGSVIVRDEKSCNAGAENTARVAR